MLNREEIELAQRFRQVAFASGLSPEAFAEKYAREPGDPSASTLRRWSEGQFPSRMKGEVRAFFLRIVQELSAGRHENGTRKFVEDPEAPDTLQRVVLDPDNAKRLVGQVRPEDVRSRLAIVRVYEDAFLASGNPVPKWIDDLRQAVMDQRDI